MAPMAEETKDSAPAGMETKDFHPGMYAPAAVPNTDLNTTDHTYDAKEAETPASDDSAPRKTTASKSTTASK